jgi:hypothetical protein
MAPRTVNIEQALRDPNLLGAALGDPATWATWIVVLRAMFGLPLDDKQLEIFHTVAGGRSPLTRRVRELWAIAGRRGGKSRIAALIACYIALFCKHRLSPGETGMVLILAASVAQSRTVFGYVKAFLHKSPVLRKEIASETKEEIVLHNGITICSHANSFRTVRGRTLVAAILDEVSFWRDDQSAMPDIETYTALLPSLATCNGVLIGISSPYRKVGLLHQKHKSSFGVDNPDVLVVQGSSKSFNATLSDAIIATMREADPTAARSEWDSEFRSDLTGFLDEASIEMAIDRARPLELPYRQGQFYRAFVDAAGGSIGGDAYSIAIAHREDEKFVVDCVRGVRGPFNPQEVTTEFANLCKDYKVATVVGDRYSASWVQQSWRDHHITYVTSDLTASQLFLETLPLFNRGLVALPDHSTLLRELRLLERSPSRLGRDTVSHPRNAHDDHANAVCGCLRVLANYLGYNLDSGWLDDDPKEVMSSTAAYVRSYCFAMSGRFN